MGSDETQSPEFYRLLVERCSNLVVGYAELRAEIDELKEEQGSEEEAYTTFPGDVPFYRCNPFPGGRRFSQPFKSLVHGMGHAVHVTAAFTGEIIFWNQTAEKLYGWKDYEVIGRRFSDVLIVEEYADLISDIMEMVYTGRSWSGQFPLKKKSGEIFFALLSKSPLYEDGVFVGVTTMSSDARLLNRVISNFVPDHDFENTRAPGVNSKRSPLPQRPLLTCLPHIDASASNLASEVMSRRHDDQTSGTADKKENTWATEYKSCNDAQAAALKCTVGVQMVLSPKKEICQKEESVFGPSQPVKFAAKMLGTLNRYREKRKGKKESSNTGMQSSANDKEYDVSCSNANIGARCSQFDAYRNGHGHGIPTGLENVSSEDLSGRYDGSKDCKMKTQSRRFGKLWDKDMEAVFESSKAAEVEVEIKELHAGPEQFHIGVESTSSGTGSSTSKADRESKVIVNYEIRWEDLHLGDEIGQGSHGLIFRGVWNGSDVAVEVLTGNDYNPSTLLDCKREIDLMSRLRHPNVLLFMGACYSEDRLAIITEYMPRGDLFKILHKRQHTLDSRRLLMMGLDVARGMNYLHRRKPPIVHGDLKSSVLLVDKKWTVKVGDFGLSRLKQTTLLSAKTGAGSPEWMAPELLRSERSNEKSDVFSFGVILWELMTQSIPWSDMNASEIVGAVGFLDKRLDIPNSIDSRIASIIAECWLSDPQLRPSFQEIIHKMMPIIQNVHANCLPKKALQG